MAITLPENVVRDYTTKVADVLRSGAIAEGPCRGQVESKISALFTTQQVKSILTSSNGTGLFASLQFYKTQGFTHVIVQSNTMYGIKTIVNTAGMTPVVIASPNLVMDHVDLAEYLDVNPDTKFVVLYSHIGGGVGYNIGEIAKTCEAYGAPLLEDCAHSLGAQDTLHGDAGVFSLYATKALPAGEGGVIFTKNEDLYEFVTRFIMYDRIHMEYDIGVNVRVSEVSALLASVALDHLPEIIDNRRATMLEYEKAAREAGIFTYYQDQSLADQKNNAYKFIITDPRVIQFFADRIVTQGEYTGNDVLTGTVFGYSLDPEVCAPVPHICLNTNYGVSQDLISATIDLLKKSVA